MVNIHTLKVHLDNIVYIFWLCWSTKNHWCKTQNSSPCGHYSGLYKAFYSVFNSFTHTHTLMVTELPHIGLSSDSNFGYIYIAASQIKDAAILLWLSLISPITWRLSGWKTEQFEDDRPPFNFEFSVLASHCGRAQMEGFGDVCRDTLSDWSRRSHVTILRKKINLYVLCVCLWALNTWRYFNMDNKLQAMLTLSSLLAAVVHLISAFHHATTAYMQRRKDIIQRTATVPMFSSTISPALIETTLSTELWFQRNGKKTFLCWSWLALMDQNKKLRQHVDGMTTMRALVDVFTKVTCMLY